MMVWRPVTLLALIGLLAGALPAQDAIVEDIQYAIDNFDTDFDGRVSREEFRGEPIDFLRLDLDGNGWIDDLDRDRAREQAEVPSRAIRPVPGSGGEPTGSEGSQEGTRGAWASKGNPGAASLGK